jgi:hypothetical protein
MYDDLIADHKKAIENLKDRVRTLEEGDVVPEEVWHRIRELEDRVERLDDALHGAVAGMACQHEPICLPSARGPMPFFVIQIADARQQTVLAPGQPPPIAFAICICKKCGLPYVAINKLEEAQPFEGGVAPVPMVKPGEPVGGTGDL